MKYIFFVLLVAALACGGCSPARLICMKNNTADTVHITWMASEDSIGFNPFVLNNSRELKFTIPPGANNEIKMSFGSGNWTPAYVEHLMKYLVSLEIQSSKNQTTLSSAKEISAYLLAHRKGIGSKRIEIAVTN